MDTGFIKIHRKIKDWAWYHDILMRGAMMTLILKANWKDGVFGTIPVKRGQFISSRAHLAKEFGVSQQATRTILTRLKSTNELTIESTSKFSIYTIVNYNEYQDNSCEPTSDSTNKPTSEQPASNQRATTIEEGKKERRKELKKDNMSGRPDVSVMEQAREVLEFLNERTGKQYQAVEANLNLVVGRLREGFSIVQCRQVVAKKCREWSTDERMMNYLRPKTLFNKTNFANYVGELGVNTYEKAMS